MNYLGTVKLCRLPQILQVLILSTGSLSPSPRVPRPPSRPPPRPAATTSRSRCSQLSSGSSRRYSQSPSRKLSCTLGKNKVQCFYRLLQYSFDATLIPKIWKSNILLSKPFDFWSKKVCFFSFSSCLSFARVAERASERPSNLIFSASGEKFSPPCSFLYFHF